MKHVQLFEQFIGEEATTSWSKMMKGVKAGGSGPWSLVAIENKKVVAQKIDIRDKNILPAHFEAMRKEYPKAKIHIEDAGGQVVWNEGVEITEASNTTKFLRKLGWAGEDWTPKEFAAQIKKLSDETLISWAKDNKGIGKGIPNTPLAFQQDLVKIEMAKRGLSITEALNPKEFETAVKNLAYSMPNHTKYDTDGLPSDEQIMKAMQKYQKDLYRHSTSDQKKEAVEMVKQILSESAVNEDKKIDRDAFIALLKDKYKFTFVRTTEDFDGSKGGIWTSGESSPSLGGKKIYYYYGNSSAYELGVLKKFEDAINKLGWYSEWYDAGTMMIWPI